MNLPQNRRIEAFKTRQTEETTYFKYLIHSIFKHEQQPISKFYNKIQNKF